MQTVTLANGYKIPVVGFGTWQTPDGDTAVNAVKTAIECGYTHIDGAAVYDNEKSVGMGIKESGIARENLFITSKLWNTERGYETTIAAFEKTLSDLQVDYLDLYLIHWPANKKQFDNWKELNAETWRAFEDLYQQAFLAVYENLQAGRVREDTSWSSYIIQIGLNLATKGLRHSGITDSIYESAGDNEEGHQQISKTVELLMSQLTTEDETLYQNVDAIAITFTKISSILL